MPPKKFKYNGKSSDSELNKENLTIPEKKKKLILKGAAPVDPECPESHLYHVYSEPGVIYDATLNQVNLEFNNNKFYLLQLLETDQEPSEYFVWFRWGRVGKVGQKKLEPYKANLLKAKTSFESKFQDKTKNDWEDRENFEKVPGKYDLVKLDHSTNSNENNKDKSSLIVADTKPLNKVPDCSLEESVMRLIQLICNIQTFQADVVELKYDCNKAPLGRLTKDQISLGYQALKSVEAALNTKNGKRKSLLAACNEFYTRIPHDFGMRVPPLIDTKAALKEKLELLQALSDIELAMTLLSPGPLNSRQLENPLDRHYKSLNCRIEPLQDAQMREIISRYLTVTHGSTHNTYKMNLLDVYSLEKPEEKSQFLDCGNRMLLWHGSRLSNWMGILSQGLRVAPPEAPVTGYMFGKGVYFADVSSKSANYAYPTRSKNEGVILLCEVALGTSRRLLAADYQADVLPAGTHSVHGAGAMVPDSTHFVTTSDGLVIPCGPLKKQETNEKLVLNYNEYVVYDPKQVRMKYLLKIRFEFI